MKKHRLLAMLLAGTMAVSMVPAYAADIAVDDAESIQAEQTETPAAESDTPDTDQAVTGSCSATSEDSVIWTLDNGTLTISGTGQMKNYQYWGAPWYDYIGSIEAIVVEDGVTRIGAYAFQGCSKVSGIDIPDSVTGIRSGAFDSCSKLTDITIPKSVTSIGNAVFRGCKGLASVAILNSTMSMGEGVFSGCSSLTSVMLPDGLTSIGEGMFAGCSALADVTIPSSVTSIGAGAFGDCSSLTSVAIPDTVTSIGDKAFQNCSGLESITIPNGVKTIKNGTFSCCDNLQQLVIPDSVTSIGKDAFRRSGLTSMTIPATVKSIGENAFAFCSDLNSLSFEGDTIRLDSDVEEGFFPEGVILYGKHGSDIEKLAYREGYRFLVKNGVAVTRKHFVYNGKSHTPSITVTDRNGDLVSPSEYTVSYSSGRKNIGVYKVKITFKSGSTHSGSRSATFSVLPAGTHFTNLKYSAFGKKSFTLKWKKRTNHVSGYQIETTDVSDMLLSETEHGKKKTFKGNSKTSYKVSLDYDAAIRIRTWYYSHGKTKFSKWSRWYYNPEIFD